MIFSLTFLGCSNSKDGALVIYTSRSTELIEPVFKAFTKETGIPIDYITAKDGVLIERIRSESEKTPADILMTVDVGNLSFAKSLGILAKVKDDGFIKERVPAYLRDSQNYWFGITVRARAIVYNHTKVNPESITSYEALANSKFKSQLLLRTSKKIYNQSLIAALIHEKGEKRVKKMLEGWMSNLAKPVFNSDRAILEAIDRGDGSIGILNSYYYADYLKKHPDTVVKVLFPKSGTHVNISGVGIIAHSSNKDRANTFLRWLVDKKAQELLVNLNMEYPVNQSAVLPKILKDWGVLIPMNTPLERIIDYQKRAISLMDAVSYY